MRILSRRQFLGLGLVALPAAAGIDGRFAEPTWLRVTRLDLHSAADLPFCALQRSALQGRRRAMRPKLSGTINALAPEFVCFTGDLVEEARFAAGRLDFIRQIARPVYGCPGNWDYNSGADFKEYEKAFGATGGAWLDGSQCRAEEAQSRIDWDGDCVASTSSANPKPRAVFCSFIIRSRPIGSMAGATT